MRIESEADLAQFEGYTEITGALEIMNAQDLVCLDTLACLETVGWDLRIQRNAALQSTWGLRNLRQLGAAYPNSQDTYAFISENDVLEALDLQFDTTIDMLVLWRNPALVEITRISEPKAGVRQLVALENPRLESLGWIPATNRCVINHNPHLCSDALAVCGKDSDSNHVLHGSECPEGPPEPYPYDPKSNSECSLAVNDCPNGQKCIAHQDDGWHRSCVPLAAAPKLLGEPCEEGEQAWDEVDDCETVAFCFSDGMCRSHGFGDYDRILCPRPDEWGFGPWHNYDQGCAPQCDPLADTCPDGFGCFPVDYWRFDCVPVAEEVGPWEPCQVSNGCQDGLFCVNPDLTTLCNGLTPGCCAPACDTRLAECPEGMFCSRWWDERFFPVPVLDHVGICIDE